MKKSSVSYGIILNLKPFLKKDLLISKRCFVGAGWTKCTQRLSPGKQISDPSPLPTDLLLHSPYLCVLLLRREPLTKFLSSSISPCSCCLTSSAAQNPGQWCRQLLISPVAWMALPGVLRPQDISVSPVWTHLLIFIFLPHPQNKSLLGVGGVVTRTAAVQGAGLSLAVITLLL